MTSPLPDGYRFETLDLSRKKDLLTVDTWAFPTADNIDDFPDEAFGVPWERMIGVAADGAEGGELAACYGAYTFTACPVPGGTLPMGGLTWVGVHPQHRRRGILRAMMAHHLTDCAARGEVLSGLTAAEYPIYGRFGYGPATERISVEVPRGAALRDVPGSAEHTVRIEQFSYDRHAARALSLHERVGAGTGGLTRPGWVAPEGEQLLRALWNDAPMRRHGKESRRIVVVERDGEPRGYATFRRGSSWTDSRPTGKVEVGFSAALDPAAAHALWSVLLDLDLMATVAAGDLYPDAPLLHLLVDRRAAVPKVADGLWVRLVDVAAALAGRQYQAPVDVVLGITDALLPANAGAWHLRAEAFGEATCTRASATPDLELDVRELGAAYLGGVSLAALAGVGLVTERTPGALARAAAAFGWPVTPALGFGF